MTTEIANLGYRVDSSEIVRTTRDMTNLTVANERAEQAKLRTQTAAARLNKELHNTEAAAVRVAAAKERAARSSQGFGRSLGAVSGGLNALMAPFRNLQLLLGATFGGFALQHVAATADAFTNLHARLALVSGSAEEASATMDRLFAISQANRQSFQETGNLFARVGLAMKDVGVSADDTLKVVDTLQKAIVIGGSSAQEASAGLRQMAQALGSGRLSGDEFRSMMENLPGVARVLADALGVPTGALKRMAQEGRLTSDILVEAFLLMNGRMQTEFDKMPLTVGQAMEQVRNAAFKAIGEINQAFGASTAAAEFVSGLAAGLGQIPAAAKDAATALREIDQASGVIDAAARLVATVRAELGLTRDEAGAFGTYLAQVWAGTRTDLENLARVFTAVFDTITAMVRTTRREIDGLVGLFDKAKDLMTQPGLLPSLSDIGRFATGLFGRRAAPPAAPPGDTLSGGTGDVDLGGSGGADTLGNSVEERLANLRARIRGSGLSDDAQRTLDRLETLGQASGLSGYEAQVNKVHAALQKLASQLGDDEASMQALTDAAEAGRKTLDGYVAAQQRHQQAAAAGQQAILTATRNAGIVWNELTGRFEANERAVAVARKQHELMTSQALPLEAGAARKAAEAWADNEIAIKRANEATQKAAERANALADMQRDLADTLARTAVGDSLVPQWNELTRSYEVNEDALREVTLAQQLYGDGTKVTRAEAEAQATALVAAEAALRRHTERATAAAAALNALNAVFRATNQTSEQIAAVRALTVEYDAAAAQFRVNDRALRILQKTQELMQASSQMDAAAAHAAAAAYVDQQIALQRLNDEQQRTVEVRNRLLAAEQDTAVTQLRTGALAQATTHWNALTQSYELNTHALDVLNKMMELTNNGTLPANEQEVRKVAEAWVAANEEFKKVEDVQRKQQRDWERNKDLLLEPFKNAARAIQALFADTFEAILNGGKVSLEKLAEAGTRIFAQTAGAMASNLVMRPMLANLEKMNTAGSFLGIGGGTWGSLGVVGGNLLLNRVLGPRPGSFADLGSLVGGLAGASFGPLGLIGGSLLGNLAGGLFGKSSSGAAGRANLELRNGSFTSGAAAGDNGADISGIVQQVQQAAALLNTFKTRYGLTTAGSGWLGALGFGNPGGTYSGSPEELVASVLRSGALQGTGTIGTILRNSRQTTLEGLAGDLDFAKLYDDLVKINPALTQTEQQIDALRKQFAEAGTRAAGLGLSVDALNAALARAIGTMRDDFNKNIQLAILAILDPDAAALKQLEELQAQRLKDAKALGADLVEVERLAGLERKKLLEEQSQAVTDSLRRLVDDLKFGPLSPLSAADRLEAVQAQYGTIEARALAGDKTARGEFEAVARQLLDVAQENFASSAGFQSIFDRVLASAQVLLGGVPGGAAAANDNVVSAVETGTDNIVAAIDDLREENQALHAEIGRLNDTLEQYVAGQQAAGGRA